MEILDDKLPEGFDLDELVPEEATLVLSSDKSKPYTLRKFSLRYQAWARKVYGDEGFNDALKKQNILVIAACAYELMKDKGGIPTLDDFYDLILTGADKQAVITAVYETVGMSQPIMKKLAVAVEAELEKKRLLSSQQTGQNTTTSSPVSGDTI